MCIEKKTRINIARITSKRDIKWPNVSISAKIDESKPSYPLSIILL